MFSYLKGQLVMTGEMASGTAYLIVEVNGIGYQVLTSQRTMREAYGRTDVMVYTTLVVREDAMQLVGFLQRQERELFEMLQTASGVGTKLALALMTLPVSELASAILSGDAKRLSTIKGVGPKLAQKITLELKDKLTKWRREGGEALPDSADRHEVLPQRQSYDEAETVLLSLGYTPDEVYRGLAWLEKTKPDTAQLSAEDVLQHVLKWLATESVV